MTMPFYNDFAEILKSFTPAELAAFMARTVLTEHDGTAHIAKSLLLRSDHPAPLVAKVTPLNNGGVVEVRVHEAQRDEGYYVVYETNYVRNAVAWWSAREAAWFTTHECDSRMPAPVSVVNYLCPAPLIEINTPKKEATDGR